MKNIPLLLLTAFILLSACSENERLLYDKEDVALNFTLPYRTDSLYANFMFLPDDQVKDTVKIKLDLMGLAQSKDLDYYLKVVEDKTSAQSGIHYRPLESKYVFPKGELSDTFELEILRDESLEQETARLVVAFEHKGIVNPGVENRQFFILNITDNLLIEPPLWRANMLHYKGGIYHPIKCKKFIEISGATNPNWHPKSIDALEVYVRKCKLWFEENPTYYEDGNRMYFEYGK